MVAAFALLSNLLLASVAVALPAQLESLAPVEQLINPVYYNSIRGGVFLTGNNGSFYAAEARFTVPDPVGKDGSMAIWAGLDGPNCNSTTFAAGIDVIVTNGEASFATWAVWYPGPSHHFQNFAIHIGDTMHFQVFATSPTTGVAWIENLTTGKNVFKTFSSEHALCQKNVQWYVEDFRSDNGKGNLVPLLDFGTLTFSQATAFGPNGTYGPSGSKATVAAIEQNNMVLTRTTVHNNEITIMHV